MPFPGRDIAKELSLKNMHWNHQKLGVKSSAQFIFKFDRPYMSLLPNFIPFIPPFKTLTRQIISFKNKSKNNPMIKTGK